MDVRVTTLPNGLRVATARMPQLASIAAGLWIGVGGRHEPARLTGLSHFLEHLAFKGTRTRSARAIAKSVEGHGGYLDAYTQEELTCFHARVAAEHLRPTLELLADLQLAPRLAVDDIVREKQVIAEEIAMYRDQPAHLAEDLLMEALWPGHPLGRPITGTEATLARMDRAQLAAFHDRHYTAPATVLSVAGAVEHDEVLALAKQCWRTAGARRPPAPKPVDLRRPVERLTVRAHASEQVQLSLGFRAFGRRDPRRFALRLASVMLGENMSSRLFRRVREERGWAYSISSSVVLLEDTGFFAVDAGLDGARTMPGLALMMKEIRALAEAGPSRHEWRAARDYALGQLRIGLETPSSQMAWVGEPLVAHGRWVTVEQAARGLAAVTPDAVRDVLRAIVRPARSALVLVGGGADKLDRDALLAAGWNT